MSFDLCERCGASSADKANVAALLSQIASMDKEREKMREAVRVLRRGVLAGQMARACLRRCPSNSCGAGGQTLSETVSRLRFHNVPLSIFDDLSAAEEAIWDNPIARAAVNGGEG